MFNTPRGGCIYIIWLIFFKANVNIFDFVDEVLFQSLQNKFKIIKFPIIFYKSKSLHNSNKYEIYMTILIKKNKKKQT